MTYTEKKLDQFLHGISLSLLSKKSAQHWRYDEETAKEIEWLEALERKVRADKADRKTENSSEKPNNCEHITEDGVTCAKYPACDDCLDNPLNKVKGSERLVKGSEQTDCQTCKWWSSYGYCVHRECKGYEPKDEPQTCSFSDCDNFKNPDYERCIECKRKQIKLKTEQMERKE